MSTSVTMVLHVALELDEDYEDEDHYKICDKLISKDWDELAAYEPFIVGSDILHIESYR